VKKLFRFSLWTLAAIVCLAAVLALYLRSADLSIYEDEIENYLSEKIGHRLEIHGQFELQVRALTRLTAEGIALSNSAWQPESSLVSIGHLSIAVDLWSLFAGPVIIENLDIRDIAVHIERNAERQSNWATGKAPPDEPGEIDTALIAFRNVNVEDVRLAYVDSQRPRPIDLALEYLNISPDENDILDLDTQGTLNEFPLWADGKLGPWQNLLDGKDLTADLDVTLGQLRLEVAGSAEDTQALTGVEASFSLNGPSIERITERLGLPPFAQGEFQVDGRLRKLDGGNQFRVEGNLGAIEILANGSIDSLRRPDKAQFDFNVAGPDSRYVAALLGVDGVPEVPFRITGDLRREDDRLTFSGARARLGENAVGIDGWVETRPVTTNIDVTIDATGPDFSVFAPFIGFDRVPEQTFEIDGRIRKTDSDWQFDDVSAIVGENRLEASGAIAAGKDTEVVFRASGPDNTVLQAMTKLQGLPPRPFDITARLQPDSSGIRLHDASAIFGEHRIEADGVVGTGDGLVGTRLDVSARGPELHNVALLTGVPYLPDGPFDMGATLEIERDRLVVSAARAVVGDLRGSASGNVGLGSNAGAFDLTVAANGPDVAGLASFEWMQALAGDPVSVSGRVQHSAGDYELESVEFTVGAIEAKLDGTLSTEPLSNDSDLTFRLAGPDMDHFVSAFGLDFFFPAKPFTAAGQFNGTPNGFSMRDFTASIGDNEVDGVFTAELGDKPTLTGSLSSAYLDLTERVQQAADQQDTREPAQESEFFFSAEPLDATWLDAANVDVGLSVEHLIANQASISDLQLGIDLQDGILSVAPVSFRDQDGKLEGNLRLTPRDGSYELAANLVIENVRLGTLGPDDKDRAIRPPLDGSLELRGTGRSLHEIMASSSGQLSLRQGSGQILNRGTRIFGDLALEVIRTLNPLRSKSDYRQLDCGIYEVLIEDGVATIKEFAIQTDTLTTLASGQIMFDTENLDVTIRSKPREGIGVSIGGLTASFLKVGGTLKSPQLMLDAKGTATTTGIAVATGGFSLLAKGLADRLSASADICAPMKSDQQN